MGGDCSDMIDQENTSAVGWPFAGGSEHQHCQQRQEQLTPQQMTKSFLDHDEEMRCKCQDSEETSAYSQRWEEEKAVSKVPAEVAVAQRAF